MISKSVPARARTRTFAIGIDYVTAHTHQRAVAAAGATFEGGVNYASAPEKAAWVHLRGVSSIETAALEMEAVAALSSRCRDPVYHLIIAYAKHERPTREQVVSDAERLLKAIGMERNQYVLAAHKDTDDFHAHVIANRVGLDGRANDLWHERIIRERVCAEISAERGWDIVAGRHNRDIVQRIERLHDLPAEPERRMSDRAYRRLHNDGVPPWEDIARPYVLDAADRASNWSDLHRRLAAHGVIVKRVERGGRIQGLAFSEGYDRTAPGCAASRIDRRCAMAALEKRFGPFTPLQPTPVNERPEQWVDKVRSSVLHAVDEARSWDELKQKLAGHGVVIKLVARGGRVQGLAFAQGHSPDAPGCAASRIDSRCKKAALERRFGPFTDQEPQRRESEPPTGEKRNSATGSHRAVHAAGAIVDHARMQSEYAAYRNGFLGERAHLVDARYAAAWERERSQRQREALCRRQTRQLLRNVARLGTHGIVARHLSYWSIDAMMSRRRAQEYDAARVRWESAKIVFASERADVRKEKPMDYRSFVAEKARAGDDAAQRVLRTLTGQRKDPSQRVVSDEQRSVAIGEVRARLAVIAAEEQARYERARVERARLSPVEPPRPLDEVLSAERQRLEKSVVDSTAFTSEERAELNRLAEQRRSWNPLTRAAAAKGEAVLRETLRARQAASVSKAMAEFETREAPQIAGSIAVEERRHKEYVGASMALEREMNGARVALRERAPVVEQQLNVLERVGVDRIDGYPGKSTASLGQLAVAVAQQYRHIPDAARVEAERNLRRQRSRDRMRDSIAMGDR